VAVKITGNYLLVIAAHFFEQLLVTPREEFFVGRASREKKYDLMNHDCSFAQIFEVLLMLFEVGNIEYDKGKEFKQFMIDLV
jgi:hypothetical protein